MNEEDDGRAHLALTITRVWLPVGIAVIGIVAIILGHARTALAGAGVVILGIALIVWMINWMFRMSVQSNKDREHEEHAREYFDRHGHWPDEDENEDEDGDGDER